jgi:hypothetical protein
VLPPPHSDAVYSSPTFATNADPFYQNDQFPTTPNY